MKLSEAAKLWLEYHKTHSKQNSVRAYKLILSQLCEECGNESLEEINTEKVLSFLNRITEGRKRSTKRTRYSHLLSFFNFINTNLDPDFRNPCDTPLLRKLFRTRLSYNWNIIEKETVDEIIFRTSKPRNRLMLELMARGGMRISEVLKLTAGDLNDRRLTLKEPKSGREQEFIFYPPAPCLSAEGLHQRKRYSASRTRFFDLLRGRKGNGGKGRQRCWYSPPAP